MTVTTDQTIEQFRRLLQTIDPAALTVDDRLALLDLFQRSMPG